ncbi:MAG: fatty acid desaturase family protein [Rhizomicrobium sp.]
MAARARAEKAHRRINVLLLVVALLVALLQYFVAPLLLPATAASALAIICLCSLATPLHWGLIHESIHGNLFDDPVANRWAGRVLGWFLCLSWDVMRFGHLLHHSHNRHEFDRPEAVSAGASRWRAAGPYFFKLLGGHALTSVVSSIALALPSPVALRLIPDGEPVGTTARRAFAKPDRQNRIRGDFCATVLLLACACVCWRVHWPVLVAAIGARFAVLSLLDNAPHYGTALDSGVYARNTRLPRFAEWLVMGHNFHGIHHGASGLKWHELRPAFARTGAAYESGWVTMVLRQFRGPLYFD